MGRRAETGVGSGRIVGSLKITRYNDVDTGEAEGTRAPLLFCWGLAVPAYSPLSVGSEGDLPNRRGGRLVSGRTQSGR